MVEGFESSRRNVLKASAITGLTVGSGALGAPGARADASRAESTPDSDPVPPADSAPENTPVHTARNSAGRARLRDLGIVIGTQPTGEHNAITDVPGVTVGYKTLVFDDPGIARTGVTVIVPRHEPMWRNYCYAGYYSHNGNGELTGAHWITESGWLTSCIGITNTHQVGVVRDALIKLEAEHNPELSWRLPAVAETWDGPLNDIGKFWVTEQDVREAMNSASNGPLAEGNVGGGTGMSYFGFKGGSGTASRVVDYHGTRYTVGVFVQSNYGSRRDLRVNGAPVGVHIPASEVPDEDTSTASAGSGSCIIVIATDAPMLADQCRRLAVRAGIGLADTGGYAANGSGDIYLAFSTGNDVPPDEPAYYTARTVSNEHIDPFFVAVDEAAQEALHNSATMAETVRGVHATRHAIPLDRLEQVVRGYRLEGPGLPG